MTDRPAGPASDQPARFAADLADPAATFCGPPRQRATAGAKDGARPREPTRGQQAWGRIDLDDAVAEDDPVRSIRAQGSEVTATKQRSRAKAPTVRVSTT